MHDQVIDHVNTNSPTPAGLDQFIKWIETNGVPDLVAFDYDLADVVELKEELPIEEWFDLDENRVYTGLDCAKFLLNFCKKNNLKLPEYIIHSANPCGSEEIKRLILKI